MLPKKNRISKKDFPSPQRRGFRVFSPFFSAIFYSHENSSKQNRVAIVVSKKTAKTAVSRNLLRRRFYNLIRPHLEKLLVPTVIVFYPKLEAGKADFTILESEIEGAFQQVKTKRV